MNTLVRRSIVDSPFAMALPLFRRYVGRTVSLFGLAPVKDVSARRGATAWASLQEASNDACCRVHWQPIGSGARLLTEFDGVLWLEPDGHDERRSWLVLDGEFLPALGDPFVARRLATALASDLLARVGGFVEGLPAEELPRPG